MPDGSTKVWSSVGGSGGLDAPGWRRLRRPEHHFVGAERLINDDEADANTHKLARTGSTSSAVELFAIVLGRHDPDILTIIFSNDCFSLSLTLDELEVLFLVCKRARPILMSRLNRFRGWCQVAKLCSRNDCLPELVSFSEMVMLARHYEKQDADDCSWLVAQADRGDAVAQYFLARVLMAEAGGLEKCAEMTEVDWDLEIEYTTNSSYASATLKEQHIIDPSMSNASLLQDLSVDHRSPVLSTRSGEIFCCLKDSAVAGHPGALFYLAQCCELGVSTAQDTFRAEGLYRKAAFDGCKEAQEALVLLYTMDDDRFPWGINAANFWRHYRPGTQQVAESQFEVGICYANGHGVPREDTKAAEWLAKAAQQGHAAAQYTLSLCYNDGIGVHKDRSAAAHWLTKAAEHGHPDAQYRLGKHHLNGRRTATDLILAVNWLAQAAELGHVEAQYMLGSMFYHGHGAPRDWAKAIDWFAKAWAGGHPQAQEALDRLRRETSCVATFDDLARP